jgi:long-chain acyl-CoA synthetase
VNLPPSIVEDTNVATLWDVLTFHAQHTPDQPALTFEGRSMSYGELLFASTALACELIARGIRASDRVGYLGKNSDLYFVLLFAIARIRAVLVPLNWRLASEEWDFIVRDCDMAALFCDEAFRERSDLLCARLALPAASLIPTEAMRPGELGVVPGAQEVVIQVYTSGTTGTPKGAMLSHRNLLALRVPGYRAGLLWFPRAEDISLVSLPVAHIAGAAYGVFGLYAGGRVVIAREFDPGDVLRLVEVEGVNHLLMTPATMRLLLEHSAAASTNFSTLKYILYGASPIPEALLRRAIDVFGCQFAQMYGMTEAGGGVVALSPEDHSSGDAERLRSAGQVMPGAEIKILGAGSLPSEEGEVLVRSDAVMLGYWRRPEATAEAITNEGWLRTGDVGRIDEEGYLFILDRAKDTIVSGGENIYPAEVENAIFGHPNVADVAVIGVPSERWGEEVMAIIVPREGACVDLSSIDAWARERIAAFKVPKRMALVNELPRNAGGKVLRRLLREPYWEGMTRRVN